MRKNAFLATIYKQGFPSSRHSLTVSMGPHAVTRPLPYTPEVSPSCCLQHLVLPATLGTFPARSDRFQLTFHAASDEDIFPTEVLEARMRREAASLEAWQRMAGRFKTLTALHAWLHSNHTCYAVARQVSPPGAFM